MDKLLQTHGGYRHLKSYQVARLAYDVTIRFCDSYISIRSRTHDQMVQAARSGVQNIAEGSQASGTSKKTELKLTNVARASLEELRLDYEDFLRHRNLKRWEARDPRTNELVRRRPESAEDFAEWVRDVRGGRIGRGGQDGLGGQEKPSTQSIQSTRSISPNAEIAANGALVLIAVACSLLDRQIATLARQFEEEGGFTERLYRIRKQRRDGSGFSGPATRS